MFFLVLRGVVSSFLIFFLLLLLLFIFFLFLSSVFVFFFLVFLSSFSSFLSGDWWVFFCSFLELFLELLCLDLLSCCVRAWFSRWWDGLADLLQSGLLLRTAGSVSLPEGRHVGAQVYE